MPIPDNIVENLRETDKVIMTDADSIKFKSKIYTEKYVHNKPEGLWYGMGDSWIDWVRHEMPAWESNNLFKLDLDESKIIKLNNEEELLAFNEKYGEELCGTIKKYQTICGHSEWTEELVGIMGGMLPLDVFGVRMLLSQ